MAAQSSPFKAKQDDTASCPWGASADPVRVLRRLKFFGVMSVPPPQRRGFNRCNGSVGRRVCYIPLHEPKVGSKRQMIADLIGDVLAVGAYGDVFNCESLYRSENEVDVKPARLLPSPVERS